MPAAQAAEGASGKAPESGAAAANASVIVSITVTAKTKKRPEKVPPHHAAAQPVGSPAERARSPSAMARAAGGAAAQADSNAAVNNLSVTFTGLDGVEQASGPVAGVVTQGEDG